MEYPTRPCPQRLSGWHPAMAPLPAEIATNASATAGQAVGNEAEGGKCGGGCGRKNKEPIHFDAHESCVSGFDPLHVCEAVPRKNPNYRICRCCFLFFFDAHVPHLRQNRVHFRSSHHKVFFKGVRHVVCVHKKCQPRRNAHCSTRLNTKLL